MKNILKNVMQDPQKPYSPNNEKKYLKALLKKIVKTLLKLSLRKLIATNLILKQQWNI